MTNEEIAAQSCKAMCEAIDAVAGVFLDATSGMERLVADLEIERSAYVASFPEHSNATDIFLEQPLVYQGIAEGSEGPLHFTTNQLYLQRNSVGGENCRLLANLCLVAIYQYWDDLHRQAIANALGVPKDDIRLDAMGELRHIRRSIVHAGGRAESEVARNRLLPRFKGGQRIVIDAQAFVEIVFTLKRSLQEYADELSRHEA
jgi:hypothetical protein